MTTRTTRFQVEFTADGSGNVKAEIAAVGKAAEDSGKRAAAAGEDWTEFGQKIGNAIRWAGFAAAAGIAIILRNTAKASQELPQLDAVLKSTGNTASETRKQLIDLAEQLADKSTFSTGAIIEAETRLLSYSGILGQNIPRAMQTVIDQSARLGISLSQSAEIVGRALESPTKAAGALAQQGFGAAFTKDVRDQIKALEQAGKAGEAQQVILGILEESYAGAAEAARGTFGGALSALGNELEDLTTGDSGSLPAATQSLNELVDLLGSAETKDAFDSITGSVLTLTGALATLIVRSTTAWEALQRVVTNAGGGHGQLFGGENIAAQRSELAQVQEELRRRQQADEAMLGGVLTGDWLAQRGTIASRIPARAIGFQGIGGSTDTELRNRAAALQSQLELNELLFGDPSKPQVRLIDNGQALPDSVLNPTVTTNGGGGSPDPDADAGRRAERIARAIEAARGVQADWHRELASEGNPILDAYADRLGKIESQTQAMARAKVPTDQIAAYREEMEALAASLRDKDLAEYQREFAEETAALAAAQGEQGAASALKYAQAMEELRKQQELGLITADMAAEREQAYASQRDSAAIDLLRSLEDERIAVGMTSRDYEVYTNLKRAGVEADSELGQSIAGLTRILQQEREAVGLVNDTQAATVGLLVDVGSNWDDAGDAVENFGQRMQRVALNLLTDRAVQWLFSLLGGMSGYTGDGTGAGSLAGFGNNMSGFLGTGRATGGGVGGRGAYPVGENGKPELLRIGSETWLIPGRDGVVMPARDAGSAGGGGGTAAIPPVTINVHEGADRNDAEVSRGADGGLNLELFLERAINTGIARGRYDSALGSRFALRVPGVARG